MPTAHKDNSTAGGIANGSNRVLALTPGGKTVTSSRRGEAKTKHVLGFSVVAVRLCTVSFKAATGISHSVDVEAGTLYEAAALGLSRLQSDGWVEGLGPGSRLEITVREPGTHHVLSVQQLQKWLNSVTPSPVDVLRKAKLKNLLGS